MRRDYCLTSNEVSDYFVGVRFIDGIPQVVFPHGFSISDDDKELRKDVFRLLSVIKRFSGHVQGDMSNPSSESSSVPLSSYQYVIQDYLAHGYYIDTEVRYIRGLRGKINWKRTIQKEKTNVDGDNVVYLNFQIKTNKPNAENLITNIHKYCVYWSFKRFGWLYLPFEYLPSEPLVKLNKRLFINTLKHELNSTFNDDKRKLFQSMINIINHIEESDYDSNLSIGTNKFDIVWERLVDFVFGVDNKEKYFPHGEWHIIKNNRFQISSALEPDTIMKYNDKIYVLDSKYYKYGITNNPYDLPATSSIQKQITYGKRIAKLGEVENDCIYNAFIMPYESKNDEVLKFVSVGTVDWEEYASDVNNYSYVLGILLDTKHLIRKYSRYNEQEIESLANLIESSLESYQNMYEK